MQTSIIQKETDAARSGVKPAGIRQHFLPRTACQRKYTEIHHAASHDRPGVRIA